MNILPWLDEQQLKAAVNTLLQRAKDAKENAPQRSIKNVVDPFASLVLATTFDINEVQEVQELQASNAIALAISNAVGNFHQEVLGSVAGFKNHDAGYDLECEERKILAEVKNKHNTMNATNREKVKQDLDTAVRQKSGGWVAYLVIVIPKKPDRYKTKLTHREVYEVDGATFYELATGYPTALRDLYYAVERIVLEEAHFDTGALLNYCKEVLESGIPE